MRILRITILMLIGIVSLANVNQIIFHAPALLASGSMAILFLAAVSIVGFPLLQKQSWFFSATFWLIMCLFLQLGLLLQMSSNSGQFMAYAVFETTLLLLVFGAGHRLNKGLQHVDQQGSETAVSDPSPDIPTIEQAETIIHNEMTRSRHYERPLAIIAFRLNNITISPQNFNQSPMQQTQEAQLIQHLRSQMQGYQQIVRDPQNDLYYLLCPELNHASAENFGQQISETIASQSNITLHYASASFPEDCFTFNKILKEALKRMDTTQPIKN